MHINIFICTYIEIYAQTLHLIYAYNHMHTNPIHICLCLYIFYIFTYKYPHRRDMLFGVSVFIVLQYPTLHIVQQLAFCWLFESHPP